MTYIKKAYRGMHDHRYQLEPLEKRFAAEWQDIHGDHPFEDTLRMILRPEGVPRRRAPQVSDRERHVAATVVQWLGSPVGQGFLEKAMNKSRARKGSNLGKKFAEAWKEENRPPFGDTLRYMLCPPNVPQNFPPEIKDRDREVAAKVIEWLGSDDGQGFIASAMGNKRPKSKASPVFARRGRR